MYDYPSGYLHIGHWYVKTPTDAIGRFLRMRGDNVFMPIGFDAFGLPAENAAIKNNINPRDWTMANIDTMRRQLRTMGAAWDWSAEVVTCEPEYYRWNQWLFLQFLEAGLAYRAMSPVDWCPNDGTLAREQVEGADRHCWRCGARSRSASSTSGSCASPSYADELLDFSGIDWPDPIRIMQTNWIGRSKGAEIVFETAPSPHHAGGEELRVFTTRPDTLFGATFMVLAPEHPLVATLTAPGPARGGRRLHRSHDRQDRDRPPVDGSREDGRADRRGRDQPGQRRAHPDLRRRLRARRLWHRRDHGRARARRARLRVREAVRPADRQRRDAEGRRPGRRARAAFVAHTVDEVMVNSGRFTGRPAPEAWHEIVGWLAENGKGSTAVTYRLRDWLVSRQRYWGTPIPVIYCEQCGAVPVPEDQLPVLLPDTVDYRGSGENPLNRDEAFLNVACPSCDGPARRETDTMDTFIDSSWYWFRYLSPHKDDGRSTTTWSSAGCPSTSTPAAPSTP